MGTYLYTGSAMNSLPGRLSRHLSNRPKRSHWHIDYFLKCPGSRVKKVLFYPPIRKECDLNQLIAKLPGAEVIVKGFGASDCASGCPAHFYYFPSKNPPKMRFEGISFKPWE